MAEQDAYAVSDFLGHHVFELAGTRLYLLGAHVENVGEQAFGETVATNDLLGRAEALVGEIDLLVLEQDETAPHQFVQDLWAERRTVCLQGLQVDVVAFPE